MLTEENKQLFAEQVGDHIEKLNDLMVYAAGDRIDESAAQRVCLATRLLEGSTNMVGFDTWSRTLGIFRKLLEHAVQSGRQWDEQLSQIVSEILEAEEQVVAEIIVGEGDREMAATAFSGLQREIEALLRELNGGENGVACSLQFEPLHIDQVEKHAVRREGSSVLDTLIESLSAVQTALDECVRGKDRSDRTIENLSKAIGESDFYFAIVRDIVSHVAADHRTFTPKVVGGIVMDGVRDFFDVQVKLRGWNAELDMQCDDIVLDGELARALTVILECCLFDAYSMHESRPGSVLKTTVRIADRGSSLEAGVYDNGSDYFSDTEVESYDAAAFYKGLIRTRTLLRRCGGMLWVEPDVAGGERFRFTLPCRTSVNEYEIFDASGVKLAVPRHNIEDVLIPPTVGITHHNGDRYIECGRRRVPVYRIDELADGQTGVCAECERIAVMGIAEKRIGIFVHGDGTTVEGIVDQLTESDWAGLSTHQLHMGEQEYPVLDMRLVLERMDYLKQLDRVPETSGSMPMGAEVEEIDPETVVPRVLI